MSSELPDTQAMNNAKISGGDAAPHSPLQNKFLVPSPVPTRRCRTNSESQRAMESKVCHGKVAEFCREKGHGFIRNSETNKLIFVHISDIDGEFVPRENDDVTYRECNVRFTKTTQAVHVNITHLAPGVSHETWSAAKGNVSPRT